ncbi:mycothione reductase [Nocardioides insulae]|uniref:mycothione reductase n=1 Tax=Nocardioides insulae TaxID=394734 RepID=UPI000401ADB0|nr:mycothione reductase [Nocardioides insulae]
MRHFDLIVVGTGSGNSILDERFRDQRVALVEHGTFGGTCLNVGCIPTKMLVHTADLAATPGRAGRFGVDETLDGVRWPAIRDRIFADRIDPIARSGREYRLTHPDNDEVTVYLGTAAFTGHKELTVTLNDGSGTETITAEQIVLAAGGRPVVPDIEGLAGADFHTSDSVMRLAELPERMIILGSGFVAAEFAHVFSALGVRVTMVARSGGVLRHEDEDISARFTQLAAQRWEVRLHTQALRVEQSGGLTRLDVVGPDGAETIEGEVLLVATGRRPNTDRLNVAATDLAVTADGHLVVDEHQRTTVPGIWALGDISSPWALKHVANHEQRVVQHNLLHPTDLVASDHRFVPHAVFSSPQIAAVGLTEAQAIDQGLDVTVALQQYADIAYGWAMEEETGFAKLIADRGTGRLVGAHIIGPQAPTLIQPLIQAMSFDMDVRTLARGQYWIHPSMPELVENALLKLEL